MIQTDNKYTENVKTSVLAAPKKTGVLSISSVENIFAFILFFALAIISINWDFSVRVMLISGVIFFALNIKKSIEAIVKYWYLLILPVFCLLSFAWSDNPRVTLLSSRSLMFTFIISIVIAHRLSWTTTLKLITISYGIATIISLLFGHNPNDGTPWHGTHPSKNEFALQLGYLGFMLVSYGLFGSQNWRYKLLLLALGLLCPIIAIKAQSTGTLISISISYAAILTLFALRNVRTSFKYISLLIIVLIGFAFFLVILPNFENNYLKFMDFVGKDPTITGRTDLWKIAIEYIKKDPISGVGYRAFWVEGRTEAEWAWLTYGIKSKSGFHFHDTYLHYAVEIGIIGALTLTIVLFVPAIQYFSNAIKNINLLFCFGTLFFILNIIRSITEVNLLTPFTFETFFLTILTVYMVKYKEKERS